MKTLWLSLVTIMAMIPPAFLYGQGWVAEIDVAIVHDLYAYEKIDIATVMFSGTKATASSTSGLAHLVIYGNDPLSGDFDITLTGEAWEPYDAADPAIEMVSGRYTGKYTTPCTTGFFEEEGESTLEHLYVWITIHPRMVISEFLQQCDELTLTTTTCSSSFQWEVSDNIIAGFRVISGKTTNRISISRDELAALGFNDPFGRKYFRVTGVEKTTSLIQPVEIYYPAPTASAKYTPPSCHDGTDGSVSLDINSSFPSAINDFVVTLFKQPGEIPVQQDFVTDGFHLELPALAGGDYLVKIENNSQVSTYGNCWVNYPVVLAEPEKVTIPEAEFSDYNGFQVKCAGGNDGTISVHPVGGTGTYISYDWQPRVTSTNIATNLEAGSYNVKVTDSNGCSSDTYSFAITAPDFLSITLNSVGGRNGFDVSCHDKRDGAVDTRVDGGVPPYSFQWNDGVITASRSQMIHGLHMIFVEDANGCTLDQSVTLTAPAPIEFRIAEVNGITCPGDDSGILAIQSLINTIGMVDYYWSSGEIDPAIVDKPAGYYEATVTDAQGCSATQKHLLQEPSPYALELIISSDYNGVPIRCHGDANGIISALVRDTSNNVVVADDYRWYKYEDELAADAGKTTVADLAAGAYKAVVIYNGTCKVEKTVSLREPDPITIAIENTRNYHGMQISCSGAKDAALRATANGGTGGDYDFLWGTGQTGTELIDVGAGVYAVTATDMNGCRSVAEKLVVEPPLLLSSIAILSNYHGHALSCNGASDARLRAFAEGGTMPLTYAWNTGQNSQELVDVPAGNYILTARDANGCSTITDTTITGPLPVTLAVADASDFKGYNVSCNGLTDGFLTVKASGGTGVFTYRWPGSNNTGPVYANLRAGHYSVIAQDLNGCQQSIEVLVSEPDVLALRVAYHKNVSCHNARDGEIRLEANGGVANYQYSASDDQWQLQPQFGDLRAGVYAPRVMDGNGCVAGISLKIIEPPAITIEFTDIRHALCNIPQGEVTASASGGMGVFAYEWRDPYNEVIGVTDRIDGLLSGVYKLIVSDSHRCVAEKTVGITSIDGPKLQVIDRMATTCSDTKDGAVTLRPAGTGPFTFLWSNGQSDSTATKLRKGMHQVTVKDANGCTAIESVSIHGPDSLQIEVLESIQPSCFEACDGQIAVIAKGGNDHHLFEWDHQASGPIINGICGGDYQVRVVDNKGCTNTLTINLAAPEIIKVKLLSRRPPSCPGACDGSLETEASGGTGSLRYLWSTGETSSTIENLCSGLYTAIVQDANDCLVQSTDSIEDPVIGSVDLGGSIVLCKGQTHMLDAGPSWENYQWTGNNGFHSTDQRVIISEAGMYSVKVLDAQGCSAVDTFNLKNANDLLDANFLLATEAAANDTIVMIDVTWPYPSSFRWTFPDDLILINDLGDVVHARFETPGTYYISLDAWLGQCHDNITKEINILEHDNDLEEAGRLGDAITLTEFSLYPNPNDGEFSVKVEFVDSSPMVLTISNLLTSKTIAQYRGDGTRVYHEHFDLKPLSSGVYSVQLTYGHGKRYLRFIVR